jgi:hypothetical protein
VGGSCSADVRKGEERRLYRVLMGKPKGKRPLGRPSRRWEDGIRMDLREIGWGRGCTVDSVGSGQEPVEGSCEYWISLRVLAPRS